MAVLLEERQEQENEDQQEAAQPQEQGYETPEKYRDKSVKDIIQMHQEAEKLAGRQSSEVGELRKVVDDFILKQTTELSSKKEKEYSDIDFFTDPENAVKSAVSKLLDADPRLKDAQQFSNQFKKERALETLQQKHPDMSSILQDQKFVDWVRGSAFRAKLYDQADRGFDYEAADELFNLWQDRQGVTKQTAALEQQNRKQTLKTAATGSSRGSGESDTRKIYRRQDIIKLMKEDPDRYQALSDEIMRAYAENRVKG